MLTTVRCNVRSLNCNEIATVSGGDITWGDVGAAIGGIIGASGGLVGGAVGALAGKAVGEFLGCESTKNICNTNYFSNLPTTYTN